MAGISKQAHGNPKFSAVEAVTVIASGVVVRWICVDDSARRDAHSAIVSAHECGILQGCHIFQQGTLALRGIVGAGGVSCIAAKPFAAEAAPEAHKACQCRIIVFVFSDMSVLFRRDGFWQLIAALHTLEQCNEVLVAVIEDFAGKALDKQEQ